jgi:hypothetical protein
MSHTSPSKGATETNSKESKDKKPASSSEFLAAAAIKDIKRPEGMSETPKDESPLKPEKTWIGSDDSTAESGTPSDDQPENHKDKDTYASDIEHLTPGEARSVVTEYVEHRLPIIQQERTEFADSAEELAAIDANEAFLTHMRAEITEEETSEASPEDLIDQAMHDVINELGLSDTVAAREPETPDARDALPEDADDGTLGVAQIAQISEETNSHGHGLSDQEAPHGHPDALNSSEPPHNGGGDGEPPYSGDTPEEPQNPEPVFGGMASLDTEPAREINPLPPAPNDRLERVKRDAERQQDMLKGMLVGGVIGYVIGRRRGRIKTEQKLKPVQEKLQQEADVLRKTVAGHEQAIRSLAREKTASEEQARVRETRMTAVIRSHEQTKQPDSLPKQATKTPEEARADAITDILATPAKPLEHLPTARAEVARQNVAQQTVERSPGTTLDVVTVPPVTKQLERVATPKTVESMPLPTLIKASESVVVGGKSLKSYFESGRIGEHGMRRVLSEHLRTGKTEQALNVELFSHERRKKRTTELLPAHTDGNEKMLPAGTISDFHNPPTSRHTPQSALVSDDDGSRVVPPVKRKNKDGRTVSAMVVVICIILLAGVLFLVLR